MKSSGTRQTLLITLLIFVMAVYFGAFQMAGKAWAKEPLAIELEPAVDTAGDSGEVGRNGSGAGGTYLINSGDIKVNVDSSGIQTIIVGSNASQQDSAPVIEGNGNTTKTITITAAEGKTANVTFRDLNIDVSTVPNGAAVETTGDGDVEIKLEGNSILKGGNDAAGLQKGNTGILTITDGEGDGIGSLEAYGGVCGAGIGSGNYSPSYPYGVGSNIRISGGKVIAYGGESVVNNDGGAGIGGGSGVAGTNIKIIGGEVSANGGSEAAGIGGGTGGAGTDIKISGGIVNATGGYAAAGIGGGWSGAGTDIKISGGKVSAKSKGESGSGIGGGFLGAGTYIEISGGEVIAEGGKRGAGIGGGYMGAGTDIEISGGKVTSVGGECAAGIGGGQKGTGSGIVICGSADVSVSGGEKSSGGSLGGGAGIGSGGDFSSDGEETAPIISGFSEDSGLKDFTGTLRYFEAGTPVKTLSENNTSGLKPITFSSPGRFNCNIIQYYKGENNEWTLIPNPFTSLKFNGETAHSKKYGWNTMEDGSGTTYADRYSMDRSLVPALGMTLYAQWKSAKIDKAPTVKTGLLYNGEDQELITAGSGVEDGKIIYTLGEDDITPPTFSLDTWSEAIPKGKEGKTYYVWYIAVGDEDCLDTDPECLSVVIEPSYTIVFDANGGSVSPDKGTTGLNKKLTIELPIPVWESHAFKGWWDSPTGGVEITKDTVFNADGVIYAHWEVIEAPHKTVILSGLKQDGGDCEVSLYYPSKSPSYNGKAHVWAGTALSVRQKKRKAADLDIGVKGLPDTLRAEFKYKKNLSASEEKAYYYVKLHPDEASSAFKSLNSAEKKTLKKAVRKANKLLRKKENRVYFTIEKLDLSEFAFDSAGSKRGKYVFRRKDGSGDTLTLRKESYEYRDGFESKEVTELELMAAISGTTFKISEGEYYKTVSKDTVKIKGKDKNLTGETT